MYLILLVLLMPIMLVPTPQAKEHGNCMTYRAKRTICGEVQNFGFCSLYKEGEAWQEKAHALKNDKDR